MSSLMVLRITGFWNNYWSVLRKIRQRLLTSLETLLNEYSPEKNALFNITSGEKDYQIIEKRIAGTVGILSGKEWKREEWDLKVEPLNEGFLTASTVQHVGKGANLYDLGFKYSGQFEILKALLRTGFLWDKVRVHGGAYGSSNSFNFFTGDYNLISYRDPNLTETLGGL